MRTFVVGLYDEFDDVLTLKQIQASDEREAVVNVLLETSWIFDRTQSHETIMNTLRGEGGPKMQILEVKS